MSVRPAPARLNVRLAFGIAMASVIPVVAAAMRIAGAPAWSAVPITFAMTARMQGNA
jgi:hypothetical protein